MTVATQRCRLDYDQFLGWRHGRKARKTHTCFGGL